VMLPFGTSRALASDSGPKEILMCHLLKMCGETSQFEIEVISQKLLKSAHR